MAKSVGFNYTVEPGYQGDESVASIYQRDIADYSAAKICQIELASTSEEDKPPYTIRQLASYMCWALDKEQEDV